MVTQQPGVRGGCSQKACYQAESARSGKDFRDTPQTQVEAAAFEGMKTHASLRSREGGWRSKRCHCSWLASLCSDGRRGSPDSLLKGDHDACRAGSGRRAAAPPSGSSRSWRLRWHTFLQASRLDGCAPAGTAPLGLQTSRQRSLQVPPFPGQGLGCSAFFPF